MKYICKKPSNQEMFAISLSSCSRYNANFKLDQSVFAIFMTVRYIFTNGNNLSELLTYFRFFFFFF
jgi:hypothetical protein